MLVIEIACALKLFQYFRVKNRISVAKIYRVAITAFYDFMIILTQILMF